MVILMKSSKSLLTLHLFMAAMLISRCSLAWTTSQPLRPSSSSTSSASSVRRLHRILLQRPAKSLALNGWGLSWRGGEQRRNHHHSVGTDERISATNSSPSTTSTTTSSSSSLLLSSVSGNEPHAEPTTVDVSSSVNDQQQFNLWRKLAKPVPKHTLGGLSYYDLGQHHRVVFVLGGPGAGKGTQSTLLEQHYPVCHLSVGELLRNVPSNSPYSDLIQSYLVKGQIVPVEISLSLLKQSMQDEAQRRGKEIVFLVDGFPRNFDNLSGWCRLMTDDNDNDSSRLTSVLVYQCPLHVLEARILERAKESGRSDDNLASVQKRFKTFESETIPVIDALRRVSQQSDKTNINWQVVDIRGDQSLEQVWLETQQVMNHIVLNDVLRTNAALLQAVQDQDVVAYQKVCDPNWFDNPSMSPSEVMEKQEGRAEMESATNIANAQVDVISGTHVAVSYDRVLQGQPLREKRIWSHQGPLGWRNVHFARIPCSVNTSPP